MRSAAFRSLHLGEQEVRIRHFHRTLEGYVERRVSRAVTVDVADLAPGQTRAVEARRRASCSCATPRAASTRSRTAARTRWCGSTPPCSRGCVLECPVHGGRLDVRDGSPQRHPIRRPATTYPVRESGGQIEITTRA